MAAFEWLILLSIGLVLVGFLFLWITQDRAPRRAETKNDVVQIAHAVQAYELEYGKLPIFSPGDPGRDFVCEVSGDLLATLIGSDEKHNPRKLVFLEVQPAKPGRSGIAQGAFVDPWGGGYRIAMDGDGDGKLQLEVPDLAASGVETVTLKRPVAVWTANEKPRRRVRSWE